MRPGVDARSAAFDDIWDWAGTEEPGNVPDVVLGCAGDVPTLEAVAAALGGLDALVFTGGVGEHAPAVRAGAAERLAFLGVALDEAANAGASGDADVTAPGARVRSAVVAAREDLEMARQARAA